jgi:hypothetical protein
MREVFGIKLSVNKNIPIDILKQYKINKKLSLIDVALLACNQKRNAKTKDEKAVVKGAANQPYKGIKIIFNEILRIVTVNVTCSMRLVFSAIANASVKKG